MAGRAACRSKAKMGCGKFPPKPRWRLFRWRFEARARVRGRLVMRTKFAMSHTRIMPWNGATTDREKLLTREWLVTNGLGGYASGTVSGAITRRYHGLLVAALPAPLGRTVMFSHVSEFLRFSDHDIVSLGAEERAGGQLDLHGADCLR